MDDLTKKLVDSILSHNRSRFLKRYSVVVANQEGNEYGSDGYYRKMARAALQEYDIMLCQVRRRSPETMVDDLMDEMDMDDTE